MYKFVDFPSFSFSIFSRNDISLGSLPLKSEPEIVDIESEARCPRTLAEEEPVTIEGGDEESSEEANDGNEDMEERVDWEERDGREPAGGSVITPEA